MNIEKAKELLHQIRSETNLAPCVSTLDSIKMLAKNALAALSEPVCKRCDGTGEIVAHGAPYEMPCPNCQKPAESQSDYTKQLREVIFEHGALGQVLAFELCNEYDKQAEKIKELEEKYELLQSHAAKFGYTI